MTAMTATVLEARCGSLLVRDDATGMEVLVHTSNGFCFREGERVTIWYSGAMTRSIPPQITAICIARNCACNWRCSNRAYSSCAYGNRAFSGFSCGCR